jgi:hypothetical protein
LTEKTQFINAAHLVQTFFRIKFQILKTSLDRAAGRLFLPDDRAGVTNAAFRQTP